MQKPLTVSVSAETGSEKLSPRTNCALGCGAIVGTILLGRALRKGKGKSGLPSVLSSAPCWWKPGENLQRFSLNIRRKGGFRLEWQMLNSQHKVFSHLLAFTDRVSPTMMFFYQYVPDACHCSNTVSFLYSSQIFPQIITYTSIWVPLAVCFHYSFFHIVS